jgi:hypothetical protein
LVQRSEAERYAAAGAAYPLLPVAAGAAQFESAEQLPAHFSAEAVPAHFFAEAAALVPCSGQPKAQRSAAPEALAERAAVPRPEESAAWDAAAVPLRVAGHAGVAPEAAAWVVAAVLQPGAAAVQVGVAEGARQPEARDAAEVRRPEAPGVRVRVAARPSAALSVFHRAQALPWPARPPAAQFAHVMRGLRVASP